MTYEDSCICLSDSESDFDGEDMLVDDPVDDWFFEKREEELQLKQQEEEKKTIVGGDTNLIKPNILVSISFGIIVIFSTVLIGSSK